MISDGYVDGNAVGALLHDVFGQEMTHRRGCCQACGSIRPLASLLAFREAPGDVLRCSTCGTVTMVLVALPTGLRVYIESLLWVEMGEESAPE